MTARRLYIGSALAVLTASLGLGCGAERAPERTVGSVLWVSEGSRNLSGGDLLRLQRAGIGELFVEVGRLEWDGESPTFQRDAWYRAPERIPATLVIRGRWPGSSVDGSAVAGSLLPDLVDLVAEAPGYLLDVRGIHFDLDRSGVERGAEQLAKTLEMLREDLEGPLAWSATVTPEAPGVVRIVEAADFVLSFAYGERPRSEGPDRASAWSFARAEEVARSLETLGRPYLLGAVTLGWARIDDGEAITRTDLTQLAWDRRLEPALGFTLEGGDRQSYRFEGNGPTFVGGRRVGRGDAVSVTTISSAHLAALREAFEDDLGSGYRGLALYRLGSAGEGLALKPDSLIHGVSGEVPSPRPVVTVTGGRRSPGRWEVEAVVTEEAAEPTDLGFLGTNFIEVAAPEGARIESVEAGNFYRYELLKRQPEGSARATLRNPDIVRFYAPYLSAGARLASGPIRIRHRGELLPLEVSASFLAPFGREVEVLPAVVEPSASPRAAPEE